MTLNLRNSKSNSVAPLAKRAMDRLDARQAPIDFRPDDPVGWILEHFRIPRDERADMRLVLAPYQVRGLQHALSRDKRGLFNYSTVLWSDIKKSIKSCIAAAVILWRAWHTEYGQFYIVANTRDQADSRVAYYLRRAIELNPLLNVACKINHSDYSIDMPNRSHIEAISVNAAGQAGANPTMVSFTELWGATSTEAKRLWTETTLPPALLGKSQRWIDSYMGFSGESELLEQIFDTAITHGTLCDAEFDFLYENRAARMFALYNQVPRLSWQSPEYYAAEEQTLTPSEFMRVHRNAWSSASNAFVPPAWWAQCQQTINPYKGEACVVSLDAGVSDDCFAIVVVSKTPDVDEYPIRYARKWSAPHNGTIDFDEPEEELRRLVEEFHVIEAVYDAYQLHSLAQRLEKEGVAYFHSFPQGTKRLIADKQLYDAIRDRRIIHDGNPDMTEHILNANASTVTGNIDQLRIIKRAQHMKIDLAVALSMCLSELMDFNLP